MLHIEGFAAPYRSRNCFNETFTTCAFAGKLKPVEMLLEHKGAPVGWWDAVWENLAGIWVRGRLTDPFYARRPTDLLRNLPELSVSYGSTDGPREARYIGGGRFKPTLVTPNNATGLDEVSLVSQGAFKGTHWRFT